MSDLLATRWVSVNDRMPTGFWSQNHKHLSECVLVANSCAVEIAFYNRENSTWYCGQPVDMEWIDKITHWMPLPDNPHKDNDKLCGADLSASE